jgi:hypothetical protein
MSELAICRRFFGCILLHNSQYSCSEWEPFNLVVLSGLVQWYFAGYIRMVMNCERNHCFVVEGIQCLFYVCNLYNDAVSTSYHAVTSKAILMYVPWQAPFAVPP